MKIHGIVNVALLIRHSGCERRLVFIKRDGKQRGECVRKKLEQLILSSFIYSIKKKSATLIFLNGGMDTFTSAVLLAGQHTRRVVGREGTSSRSS